MKDPRGGRPQRVAGHTERVSRLPGTLVRGDDGGLCPRSALETDFTVDLPWPSETASGRVHSPSRLDDRGHLVIDAHATGAHVPCSEGRDVFRPRCDGARKVVAAAVVPASR